MGEMTSAVRGLLARWEADGRPDDWHLRPVLADAMEEAGWPAETCARMRQVTATDRLGRAYTTPFVRPMPAALKGYDWGEAFAYAGEPGGCGEPELTGFNAVAITPFARWDVAHVEAASEGENDGPSWLCVGRLYDGRWFALKAGCDYTGWD